MESGIVTMKFIAEFTDIPVPTIFGHRTSIEGNPVKLPYMLIQCIRGNMLFDLGGLAYSLVSKRVGSESQ